MPKIIFLVSLSLSLSMTAPAATYGNANIPDEQYVHSGVAPGKGYIGYASSNGSELRMAASHHVQFRLDNIYRNSNPPDLPQKILSFKECRGNGSNCVNRLGKPDEDYRNKYLAVLSGCRTETESNCVQGLSATTADGVKHVGKMLLEEFKGESLQNYVGNPAIDLPDGNSSFIVDIPGAPHAAGTKYLVVAELTSEMNEGEAKFAPARMHVGVFAVTITNGNYPKRTFTPSDYPDSQHPYGASWKPSPYGKISAYQESCVQHNTSACAVPQKLPLDTSFSLSLKLNVPVVGWFHGRVTDASLNINSLSNDDRIYEISAKPVMVPMVSQWKRHDEITPGLRDFYEKQPQPLGGTGDTEKSFFTTLSSNQWSLRREQFEFNENGMKEFLLWLDNMNDKAVATPSQWSIRSIESGNNSCYSSVNKVVGIVQTNATMYLSGPPQFNSLEGSLDYKVAGPHFQPDGLLNQGTYDLLIKKDVAQCIYGFTKAPTKATVSVLSTDGKEVAQTVVLSENDEWIKLRATGFTYSAPLLRVKLQQEQQQPAPSAASTTENASAAPSVKPRPPLKVISCIKGSKAKFVKGTSPKCPKGYKIYK